MKIVCSLPQDIWREFVNNHPLGNIFHTPEMFEVFAQAKGYNPALWAVIDNDQRPLALFLPVQITLVGGPLSRLTSRAVVYGSLLAADGIDGDQATKILLSAYNNAVRGRILFTELRHLSDLSRYQPVLIECNFAHEEHLNYLVDLNRSPEEVLQGIGRRTRKLIRRGLRKDDVIMEEAHQPDDVKKCYELLKKTYATAHIPLADKSLFEAAFEILYAKGMVKFLLARIGDDYAAGSVELIYKDRIYGWYGGMDRSFGKYTPNELLMWYILSWGAENGFKIYDFGGAGSPDEEYGVRDFKAKFGGELVNYGRNACVHAHQLLRLSTWGYDLYRRLS